MWYFYTAFKNLTKSSSFSTNSVLSALAFFLIFSPTYLRCSSPRTSSCWNISLTFSPASCISLVIFLSSPSYYDLATDPPSYIDYDRFIILSLSFKSYSDYSSFFQLSHYSIKISLLYKNSYVPHINSEFNS